MNGIDSSMYSILLYLYRRVWRKNIFAPNSIAYITGDSKGDNAEEKNSEGASQRVQILQSSSWCHNENY